MLIVALGWSLLEAILKSKTEHNMEEKTATTEDLQWNKKHSSKCTFTPLGATVPAVKTNYLSSDFSLGGDDVHWNDSFRQNFFVFWKILETHFESKCSPVGVKEEDLFPSTGRGRGWGRASVTRLRKVDLTFSSCNPRDRRVVHFSLTQDNMELTRPLLSCSVMCSVS